MFPPIEPFATGLLPVRDGNEIYWETSGNPQGRAALYLHGGPGGGIHGGYRRHFDPEKFLIVSFKQRGCGRGRPRAIDSGADLATNTTHALIADIEELRKHFGVEEWLLYGASWGTTLALAYAQRHPQRVKSLILGAVTTTAASEVEWVTEDMRRIFPEPWSRFAAVAEAEPGERIIDAYYRRILSPDKMERDMSASAWCAWEDVHVSLDPKRAPNPSFEDPQFCLLFATLVIHYWKHAAFLEDDGILENIHCIAHIPCALIHGRLDVSSPMEIPYALHKAWPGSELIVVENEGHGGEAMANEITKAVARLVGA